MVVVGGDLSAAGELLLGPLREALSCAPRCPRPPRGLDVVAGELGDRANVLGALALAIAHSEQAVAARIAARWPDASAHGRIAGRSVPAKRSPGARTTQPVARVERVRRAGHRARPHARARRGADVRAAVVGEDLQDDRRGRPATARPRGRRRRSRAPAARPSAPRSRSREAVVEHRVRVDRPQRGVRRAGVRAALAGTGSGASSTRPAARRPGPAARPRRLGRGPRRGTGASPAPNGAGVVTGVDARRA